MRWEALFRDLAGQLEAADRLVFEDEVADRSRLEVARVHLADRLRAARGADVVVAAQGTGPFHGRVAAAGTDWVLLAVDRSSEALVPVGAIAWVSGLPARAADHDRGGAQDAGPRFGTVLRVVARDRAMVSVALRDATVLTGTIDRVGADFVDLSEHPPGEARRADAVTGVRAVPLRAIAVIRPI